MVEQRKEQDTVKVAEEVGKKVLPLLEQIGGIVASAGLTDENGYIRAVINPTSGYVRVECSGEWEISRYTPVDELQITHTTKVKM